MQCSKLVMDLDLSFFEKGGLKGADLDLSFFGRVDLDLKVDRIWI